MEAYCPTDKVFKKIKKVHTERLPNGSYIQKGKCETCNKKLVKIVKGKDLEIKEGRLTPKEIFVGENTPSRLKLVQKRKEQKEKDDRDGTIRLR